MRISLGVDQLSVEPGAVARATDASLQHIANAQLPANLFRPYRPVLEGERGVTRDHKHMRDARQIGRKIVGNAIGKILLLGIVAEVGKGQHDDRQTWRNGGLGDRRNRQYVRRRQISDSLRAPRIDPQWPRDVLNALLPHVLEWVGQLVSDLVSDHP